MPSWALAEIAHNSKSSQSFIGSGHLLPSSRSFYGSLITVARCSHLKPQQLDFRRSLSC